MQMAGLGLLLACLPAVGMEGRLPVADGLEIVVSVAGPGGAQERDVLGSLVFQPAGDGPVTNLHLDGVGSYRVAAPEGVVRIVADVPGYWAPGELVAPGRREVAVLLVPTARVGGEVRAPSGTVLPSALDLDLGPASFLQSRSANPAARLEGTIHCPVADGRFHCEVPAGFHDLRWHAPGFASVLRWGVEVLAGEVLEVAPLDLAPGAAILGFVELSDEVPPLAPGQPGREVTVKLAVASRVPLEHDTRRRLGYLEQEVPTGPDGSFQFEGLAAGHYRISVESDGLAATSSPVVEVFEGRESRLSTPVRLEPQVSQEIRVLPPVSPHGRAWRIHLLGGDARSVEGFCTTGPSGDCRIRDIPAGEYRLLVEDAPGSRADDRRVTVSRPSQPIEIDLPLVAVEGEITRGGEPARARVIFHRGPGREKLETYSDFGGRFSGYVAGEGSWQVAAAMEAQGVELGLGSIEVVRPADGSPFELELELPDTTLVGKVLDPSGRPQPRARVNVSSGEGDPGSRGVTDRDGTFRVWGLEEGDYRVRATIPGRAATGGPVEVREGEVAHVEVRLPGLREVRGRLLADGRPLTGATVIVIPELPAETGGVQTTAVSGLGGIFRAGVPEGTAAVHLAVLAPGLTAGLVRRVLDGETFDLAVDRWGGTLELKDPEGLALGHGLRSGNAETLLGNLMPWAPLFGLPGRLGDTGFVLPQMQPGSYRLCSPDGQRCAEGELAVGGHLILELEGAGGDGDAAGPAGPS